MPVALIIPEKDAHESVPAGPPFLKIDPCEVAVDVLEGYCAEHFRYDFLLRDGPTRNAKLSPRVTLREILPARGPVAGRLNRAEGKPELPARFFDESPASAPERDRSLLLRWF